MIIKKIAEKLKSMQKLKFKYNCLLYLNSEH